MNTAAEVRKIESDMRAAGWAAHTSLEREFRAWDELASEVNAYDATIDDYTNDLCARDYIAKFREVASATLATEIDLRVAASDERFMTSTVSDTDGLVGRYYRIDRNDGWWWRRRPRTGPLAEYLLDG